MNYDGTSEFNFKQMQSVSDVYGCSDAAPRSILTYNLVGVINFQKKYIIIDLHFLNAIPHVPIFPLHK
jgi:hypothetical protein